MPVTGLGITGYATDCPEPGGAAQLGDGTLCSGLVNILPAFRGQGRLARARWLGAEADYFSRGPGRARLSPDSYSRPQFADSARDVAATAAPRRGVVAELHGKD